MRMILVVLILCGEVAAVGTDDWPQWRGPSLNGVSGETNLPVRWSKTENVVWKLALPAWSGSTPIVWGDRIFLSVAEGHDLYLWSVDRNRGVPIWKKRIGGGNTRIRKQNMSSPSPVTDGRSVWVLTGTGVLRAFDLDGNELWGRNIQEDYGRFGMTWGYASSPLLYDDSLYVQVLQRMRTDEPSYLLRIDKATGRTRWRVEARLESTDAYTTPGLVGHGNAVEIVLIGGDLITGHELATGRELWRVAGLNPTNDADGRLVASPVIFGEMIYVPTSDARTKASIVALKAGGRGDVTRSHFVWSFDKGPDVPTPVTDGIYLYVVKDNGVMWCLDAKSGREIYARRRLKPATYSGSPVFADGKIYITNEDGVTLVLKAGPAFEVLAENDLDEYTISSPAVSEGQIFIRTESFLYAIGHRRRPA